MVTTMKNWKLRKNMRRENQKKRGYEWDINTIW